MKIKKVTQKPFRKREVKYLPKDAEYKQNTTGGNKIYYSELKKSYYVVIAETERDIEEDIRYKSYSKEYIQE